MTAHICFEHVTASYGRHVSLDDLSLEIPEKQILGIIGPNNSGKTTLLKCINRTIVLPNSVSGILTGVILQVARAAGETAPILLTGAVISVPVEDHGLASFFPYGLGDRFMALSMHLYTLATQVRVPESVEYATAVVLIVLVLAVYSVSIGLRAYLRMRKKW
jgi:ABC-type phosphate transport system permease subunit